MAGWRGSDDWSQADMAFAGAGASGGRVDEGTQLGGGGEHACGPWGRGRGPWGGGAWGGPWRRGAWGRGFGPWGMRGPMFFRMMRRFGPYFFGGFGPGFGPSGFGPGGPGGPGFRRGFGPGGRMFGRGDLKYALLELLQERPKHGYEMIKELESRAGGFYTPSAGAVYPTLQLLEDRGWVRSETQEGKKVYTITDAGRQELSEYQARQQERAQQSGPGGWGGWGGWGGHGHHHGRFNPSPEVRQEMRAMALEGREVARLMRAAVIASVGNPQRLAQLRGIVAHARGELESFLGQQPSGAGQQGQGAQGQQTQGPTGSVEHV